MAITTKFNAFVIEKELESLVAQKLQKNVEL